MLNFILYVNLVVATIWGVTIWGAQSENRKTMALRLCTVHCSLCSATRKLVGSMCLVMSAYNTVNSKNTVPIVQLQCDLTKKQETETNISELDYFIECTL